MWLFLIILFKLLGIGIQMDVTLEASEKDILVKNSVTLECSFSDYTKISHWNSSLTTASRIFLHNGECLAFGLIAQDSRYTYGCQDNRFSLTILSVTLNDHGTSWQCHNTTEYSNIFTIHVIVPVKEVVLEGKTQVNENEASSFSCRSSYSLPPAHITFFSNSGIPFPQSQTVRSIQSDGILKMATEVLTLTLTRYDNGRSIYCAASNLNGHTALSNRLKMEITYPPHNPIINGYTNDTTYQIIEGNEYILSCSISGGNPAANLTWVLYKNADSFQTKGTNTNGMHVNTSISWTASRYHENKLICRAFHDYWSSYVDVFVKINVTYPPGVPNITMAYLPGQNITAFEQISVIEGTSFNLKCASNGNPEPKMYWRSEILHGTRNDSILSFTSVNRTQTGHYTCNASNFLSVIPSTTEVYIDVLYPPDVLSMRNYSVIESKSFSKLCQIMSGNPNVTVYKWTRKNDTKSTSNELYISTVQRSHDAIYTCIVQNSMIPTGQSPTNATSKGSFHLTVLYPPDNPSVTVEYQSQTHEVVHDTLTVIENTTTTLICSAVGNPKPQQYSWNTPLGTFVSTNGTLLLSTLLKSHKGSYSCTAVNYMQPSHPGVASNGSISTGIYIDILYPPSIDVMNNSNVIEGDNFTKACPLTEGNPAGAIVEWKGMKNNLTYSRNLSIKNVTRDHDMYFMCKAYTMLTPTVGQNKTVSVSSQFHLNVIYEATINSFYTNPNHAVLNENQTYDFICEVDSNPGATISIEIPNGERFMERSSYRLKQTYTITSCLDIGRYTCTAVNEKTKGHINTSDKDLLVNCTPIPVNATIKDLHRALHSSVTLSFIAMAYPEPTCSWQIQQSNESWFDIFSNNTQYAMETSVIEANMTFQCILTLTNFTKSTGEVFRLNVTNVVGEYVELFTLKPYGKPETPTDFDYVKRTESAIHLSWSPGFNGGIQQFFILEYKTLDSQYWKTINLTDPKYSRKMSHEIDGLASGTTYMFNLSSSNQKGTSEKLSLTVGTKEIAKQTSEVPVSGIIGGITGLIVISVGIGIAVFLYRSRYMTKNAQEDDSGPSIYQNMAFTGVRFRKQNNKKLDKIDTGHSKKIKRKVPEDIEKVINDMEEVDDIRHSQREPDNAEYFNSLDVIADLHRIKISELLWYVRDKTEDSFASEYQNLPQGLRKPCTFARKPENIALNRYNGIYPYDHSRVTVNGDPGFFMNACYISGYKEDKAYIASLGPTTKTTDDFKTFWKMVWNEKSDIIVMLTNLNEPSGMKCEQYWPQFGMEILYGDIRVKSDDEEVFSEYVVRSFTLFHGNGRRKVTQLHYTAWPDKKVPEDVSTMLEFRQKLKATPSAGNGPIIIHCSAGIGRTGTLIAIDRLIDEGRSEFSVNIFECVNSMREQRVKMVQTLDQYIYIHKALVNSLYFDPETVPIEHFHEFLQHTNNNVYSKQFQQLKESVEISSQEQEDSVSRNEQFVLRNRERSDVPDDRNRVRLYYNIQMDRPDYINATYINSFRVKDQFIVAQTPLPCTIVDFIRIMYQENCCCVVVMEDLEEPGMPIGHYLPSDDHELQIKNFIITSAVLESNEQYTVRELKIVSTAKNLEGERSMYHFHFKNWIQGNDTPSDVQQFVQFVKEVNDYSEQLGEGLGRVLVHCLKANERSALYCIVAILMEKMRYERQVNVLNTVRRVRSRRRSALISMEQLKFCYQAVGAYINMLETEERR